MKKLLLTIAMLIIMLPVISQGVSRSSNPEISSLLEGMTKAKTAIGDFTVTDTDGVTWNLYDLLDEGRTVFLDLFFTT